MVFNLFKKNFGLIKKNRRIFHVTCISRFKIWSAPKFNFGTYCQNIPYALLGIFKNWIKINIIQIKRKTVLYENKLLHQTVSKLIIYCIKHQNY